MSSSNKTPPPTSILPLLPRHLPVPPPPQPPLDAAVMEVLVLDPAVVNEHSPAAAAVETTVPIVCQEDIDFRKVVWSDVTECALGVLRIHGHCALTFKANQLRTICSSWNLLKGLTQPKKEVLIERIRFFHHHRQRMMGHAVGTAANDDQQEHFSPTTASDHHDSSFTVTKRKRSNNNNSRILAAMNARAANANTLALTEAIGHLKSPIDVLEVGQEQASVQNLRTLCLYRQKEEERRIAELEYQRMEHLRREAENSRRNEEAAFHVYERCDEMIEKLSERLRKKPNLTEEERLELVADKEAFKRRKVNAGKALNLVY